MKKPTMLMIIDGFGYNQSSYGNAISSAKTPNLDSIFEKYPHTLLHASGLKVGLPEGQMGNSEVGHLNIGAGRIVYQELTRITKAIEDGVFFKNPNFLKAINHVKENNSALHILGLLSDGGVHSHINHLLALLDLAKKEDIKELYVHCFLDGRDVPPACAEKYIIKLEEHMKKIGLGKIATISGRFYAMDRDKRWDRVENAYNAMTIHQGFKADSAIEALKLAYEREENDEFVKPTIIADVPVKNNDSMIMFNFRPDRAREITRAFVDADFDGFVRQKIVNNLCYITMTSYDATMPNVTIAYPPQSLKNTFGDYIANCGLKQLRIAETEKYAHVTFFFNGGVEAPCENEDRILVPSPKVPTYDLQPEMSALEVTEKVIEAIKTEKYDSIVLNFANADMVGHTGIMDAAIKAVETLDGCVPKIIDAILKVGGEILLTADHGNADVMLDESGNVVTAHSLNQVPLVYISSEPKNFKVDYNTGKLADIAPTLLTMMNLSIPDEMTGISLI